MRVKIFRELDKTDSLEEGINRWFEETDKDMGRNSLVVDHIVQSECQGGITVSIFYYESVYIDTGPG